MGVVQEILKNDTDGSLKRHLFRTIKFGSYAFLIVVMSLFSGIAWRLFTGSEVEVFGLKISGQTKEASSPAAKPAPAAAAGQAASSRAVEQKPSEAAAALAAQPVSSTNLSNLKISHAWTAMPHGDFQRCNQDVTEVINIMRLSDISNNGQSYWATATKDGKATANISVRCMDVNGLSLAFMVAVGSDMAEAKSQIDRMHQEFNVKNKGVGYQLLGGASKRLVIHNVYVQTTLPDAEQCRKMGAEAMSAMSASDINNTGNVSVFGIIETSRVSLQCMPGIGGMMAALNVISFNDGEAQRIRDQISGRFAAVKK
jgi:hypothetical protein